MALGAGLLALATLLLVSSARAEERPRIPNPYRNLLVEEMLADRASTLVPPPRLELSGQYRLRGILARNLDLGRGVTPTTKLTILGTEPGTGGDYASSDMRFLLTTGIRLGSEVAVRCQFALFNNLVLGSTPSNYPASPTQPMAVGSSSQSSPEKGINSLSDAISINTLYLEWLSPIGLILLGRTAGDWGLGMLANSGQCVDCDYLQTVDRVALVTSLFGPLIALSFDLDANGGHAGSWNDPWGVTTDLTDADDLRTINVALIEYSTPAAASRRILAGRTLFNWGLVLSNRWQKMDLPTYYFIDPDEWSGDVLLSEYVERRFLAVVGDLWFRVARRTFLVEGEVALMGFKMDDASLMPGVETPEVTGFQWGGVLRGKWQPGKGKFLLAGEFGVASGDKDYGFGANPGKNYNRKTGQATPQPGDMDGPQIDFFRYGEELEVNNFRFSPNYHVDEILWRRIVGTVTDCLYGKLQLGVKPTPRFAADLAGIYSRALYAQSTPGIAKNLGVELDLTLTFDPLRWLRLRLIGAALFPLDGFRNLNTVPARDPSPAGLVRATVEVKF
jgi:uncharacterized protein (TIGR04551 family)